MLTDAVLRPLRCPVCGLELALAETSVRCPRGHSFDIAKQGYVNLLTGRAPHVGDSPEMVAAREEFLTAGHYQPISTALAEAALLEATRVETDQGDAAPADIDQGGRESYPPLVVDAGAGTGRHLAAVLDAWPAAVGLALDVSKPALRRAARVHPRAGAALADTWRPLPLAEGAATVLLNVFAPRNGAEFRRVLRPDGALLVVTPAPDHLTELVSGLDLLRVDPDKAERVADSLVGHFDLARQTAHTNRLRLTRREVRTLVGMGPSAWHTDPATLADRIAALPEPVSVTAAVRLGVYHPC
ncbi:rRNA (guanine-N1)-methyltransferase [Micromonospora polyrhachis]|uniref:23S rRNA (Guanine745-N1)-methyltransferase n=1 Tax=Micromonospora polyrhachis TaxID=1282883 RepID=A0A7W7SS07_9ACTN|nr:23S rRNA methyltransferase [Micromonospora polyrhachis]MBB4959902.1 23S rRNA (guanine745-N1)-methyltransferase [Micromonospora polyrhachis]